MLNVLLGAGFGDQLLGQLSRLGFGDHPADHVTAEDVKNHVQVVVDALAGATELGNVPTPHLVRAGGQQLRFLVGWVAQLVTPAATTPCDSARFGPLHHGCAPLSLVVRPSNAESFFWTSMIVSACCRRFCSRSFSPRRRAISAACGSGLRPRFCGSYFHTSTFIILNKNNIKKRQNRFN